MACLQLNAKCACVSFGRFEQCAYTGLKIVIVTELLNNLCGIDTNECYSFKRNVTQGSFARKHFRGGLGFGVSTDFGRILCIVRNEFLWRFEPGIPLYSLRPFMLPFGHSLNFQFISLLCKTKCLSRRIQLLPFCRCYHTPRICPYW